MHVVRNQFRVFLFAAPLLASGYSYGDVLQDASKALKEGSAKFNIRYRYELVDQDGIDEEAGASTARARFTWNSGSMSGWNAGFETDYVFAVGSEQYNSTTNGRTNYPVVADPEGFDLNQAFLKYTGETTSLTAGRQRIVHQGQRFIGGVAWRQNEQTYDAVRLMAAPVKGLSIDYSYVFNVNRIFGPDGGAQPSDWDSDSHFLIANYAINEKHKITGFTYLLDFDNDNGIPNSTSTYGIEYGGSIGALKLAATYARQTDYGDSPLDYEADFYSVSAAYQLSPVTLKVGYEVLGSDEGRVAFRTPLATLHKFQGFADKFLGTPAFGIEDTNVGVSGAIGKLKLAATYHSFAADEGSADLGTEFNLVATVPVHKTLTIQFKFADYDADTFATDTTKFWLTANFNI